MAKGTPITAAQRRNALLDWMREDPRHEGMTSREIVFVSRLYDHIPRFKEDRCYDDLVFLKREGLVCRRSMPAGWWLV